MPLVVDCVTTSRRLVSYGYRTLCIDIKVLDSSPQVSVADRRLGSDGWGRYGDLCRCGLVVPLWLGSLWLWRLWLWSLRLGRYGLGRYKLDRVGMLLPGMPRLGSLWLGSLWLGRYGLGLPAIIWPAMTWPTMLWPVEARIAMAWVAMAWLSMAMSLWLWSIWLGPYDTVWGSRAGMVSNVMVVLCYWCAVLYHAVPCHVMS